MSEISESNCDLIEDRGVSARFDIAAALALPFRGLAEAVENNLHRSARTGDCKRIKNVLEGRISLHKESRIHSLKQDTESQIQSLNIFINERNRLGASPLWLASVAGHHDAVKLLIDHGADLEIEDIKGQTPLHAATKFNHLECMRILLESGSNPDGSDAHSTTPIYITARDNFPRAMALLIHHGANVDGRHGRMTSKSPRSDDAIGSYPIYMCIVYRHWECFEQLVRGGADLSLPLPAAPPHSSAPLIQGILRHNCDVRYIEIMVLSSGIKDSPEVEEMTKFYGKGELGKAKKECLAYLEEITKSPLSLRHKCRIAIRKQIGQKRLQYIQTMSIPNLLKEYLCMNLLEL